jgi:hypothetical protein
MLWRMLTALLLVTLLKVSWSPFRLDLPFRADDVSVEDSGAWRFSGRTLATSVTPPGWLRHAIEGSSLRIVLEVDSHRVEQEGPARILSLSEDTSSHDLMIGQEGEDLVVRVRRPGADEVGQPPITVEGVFSTPGWRRIDVRVERLLSVGVDGQYTTLPLDDGDPFEPWDAGHVLALGNERTWDRAWEGSIRRATVRTDAGEVDLLDAGLQRTWGGALVMPQRISEDTGRPLPRRSVVWAMHAGLGALLMVAATRALPTASWRRLLIGWTALVLVLNLGKTLIATRHPSVVTTIVQLAGGGVGLWAAARVRRGEH